MQAACPARLRFTDIEEPANQWPDITTEDDVHVIHVQQSAIGWNNVKLGILSKQFRITQCHYLSKQGIKRKIAMDMSNKWSRQVMKLLWDMVWEIWDARNKSVKGTSRMEQETKSKILLQHKAIKMLTAQTKLLAEDHHLLVTKAILLEKGHGNLKAWMRSLRNATKKYDIMSRKNVREKAYQTSKQNNARAQNSWTKSVGKPQTDMQDYFRKITRSSAPTK